MKHRFRVSWLWSAFLGFATAAPTVSGQIHTPPPAVEAAPKPNNEISGCQVGIYEYAGYVAIRDRGMAVTAVPVRATNGPEKLQVEAARRAVAHQIWTHPNWDAAEVKRRS